MLQLVTREMGVGTFHTHPYPSGTVGMAFSGADIADAINAGELLSIVQSGTDVFALFRTENTPRRVDLQRLKREQAGLRQEYLRQGRSEQVATYYADLDLCEAYALAFYDGQMSQALEEVYKPWKS